MPTSCNGKAAPSAEADETNTNQRQAVKTTQSSFSNDFCTEITVNNDGPPLKKQKLCCTSSCQAYGCTFEAVNEEKGVCATHEERTNNNKNDGCIVDGCTNKDGIAGGLCGKHNRSNYNTMTAKATGGIIGSTNHHDATKTKKASSAPKLCSFEGCKNQVRSKGVCIKHGAKERKKQLCNFDGGCTNQALKGGVCWRHGAKAHIKEVKKCSVAGCATNAKTGGVCIKHGAKRSPKKLCSVDGCSNQERAGGICVKHGATRKRCSVDECTNQSMRGGVCWRHGASIECSFEGCSNQAQRGSGVCIRHGAKTKRCSADGCTNRAISKGVCIAHGAKYKGKKLCSVEGCTSQSKRGGVCQKHGAKAKPCDVDGCTNEARKGGVCIKHGAKLELCSADGCTNHRINGGVCMTHGAKARVCSVDGCTRHAQRGGVCCKHGGKIECSVEECTNYAIKGGVCIRHGAKRNKKRCCVDGCTNQSVKRGVCKRHGAFKDVPPTVQEQDEESWGGDDQAVTEYGDSDDGELGGENTDTREDARVHELECENQALKAKLAEMTAKLAAAESQNARMMI